MAQLFGGLEMQPARVPSTRDPLLWAQKGCVSLDGSRLHLLGLGPGLAAGPIRTARSHTWGHTGVRVARCHTGAESRG